MSDTHLLETVHLSEWSSLALSSPDRRVRAIVVPDLAMLTWSLTLDGEEYLGQPNSVDAFAANWATTGIPLLHPWANRLGGTTLAGVDHPTIETSPIVPRDDNGLPIHGINLANAGWKVTDRGANAHAAWLEATLPFGDADRLAIFPFAHTLAVRVALAHRTLTIATRLAATGGVAVPVSFGWHPYLCVPGVPRNTWEVSLPVARRAALDWLMLPTGRTEEVAIPPEALGDATYDDLFPELSAAPAVFSVAGGGRAVHVTFGDGYPLAQIYAPRDRDFIAFEPMTAPTNALVTEDGLRWVAPGERFDATFHVELADAY